MSAAAACPKGHVSSEQDFCSECGAKMGVRSPKAASAAAVTICPDCGSGRVNDSARFCELCGYNFETGAHGEIPMPAAPLQPAAVTALEPDHWTVQVTIDPALKEDGSPDPPAEWQPLLIPVNRDTLLVGRSSQSRSIAPDVSLDFDTAVSHRHALLTRANGSGWSIRDIGSSNGTRLNGADLEPMVDVPLHEGDRVTLGHWTCLILSREAVPGQTQS